MRDVAPEQAGHRIFGAGLTRVSGAGVDPQLQEGGTGRAVGHGRARLLPSQRCPNVSALLIGQIPVSMARQEPRPPGSGFQPRPVDPQRSRRCQVDDLPPRRRHRSPVEHRLQPRDAARQRGAQDEIRRDAGRVHEGYRRLPRGRPDLRQGDTRKRHRLQRDRGTQDAQPLHGDVTAIGQGRQQRRGVRLDARLAHAERAVEEHRRPQFLSLLLVRQIRDGRFQQSLVDPQLVHEQPARARARVGQLLLGDARHAGRIDAHLLAGRGRLVGHRMALVVAAQQEALTHGAADEAIRSESGIRLDAAQQPAQRLVEQQGVGVVRSAMMERRQVVGGEMPAHQPHQPAEERGGTRQAVDEREQARHQGRPRRQRHAEEQAFRQGEERQPLQGLGDARHVLLARRAEQELQPAGVELAGRLVVEQAEGEQRMRRLLRGERQRAAAQRAADGQARLVLQTRMCQGEGRRPVRAPSFGAARPR